MKILRMMIIGLLISLSSSYVLVTLSMLSNNEVIVGSALLEQVIIAAILGVVIGLLSLIYDIERLPFFNTTALTHNRRNFMCNHRRLFWPLV